MIGLQSDGEESTGSKVGNKEADSSLASYAARTERSLEELLSTMEGVGKVRVMVTLRDAGELLWRRT